MDSWFFLPFPRAVLDLWNRGSGRGEEPGGAKGLRLIQIRLTTSSLEKSRSGVKRIRSRRRIASAGSYGSTAILAVGPAGICAIGAQPWTDPLRRVCRKNSQPGETPGCPTGRMPVLRCPEKI